MSHKLAIGTFKGIELAFFADGLFEYFPIDKPYHIPQVDKKYSWVQNLRGRIVTHIAWWSTLHQFGVNLFQSIDPAQLDSIPAALLYEIDGQFIGIPIDEVSAIKPISDLEYDKIILSGETNNHRMSWDGLIVIDHELIFKNLCSNDEVVA